ncbi:putative selenium delivery protein YdfZ [Atlantibacter sp.]|uniref:putative selenium delivery protein YdfZ n=1 Tax=Atlantibacter sp. TaxID=1903473 RepID=UPI0013EFA695|nr:putative selenium delivery protein YdfZ [Atlantibacter sp.]
MMTYDRNRNSITEGSRVMLSGTGQTGVIRTIHSEGLTAEQVRRQPTVEVEGIADKVAPVDIIRLGMN